MDHARKVYLQKREDGEFVTESTYAAWDGFRLLGLEAVSFVRKEELDVLGLAPDTIVQGWIGTVRYALSRLGVPDPHVPTMPEEVQAFAGRKIWTTTLGEFRKDDRRAFIKPLTQHKLFTGHVASGEFRDLIQTANFEDDVVVLASEVVDFVVEYRTFWNARKCVGARFYKGDWSKMIDFDVVGRVGAAYSSAPAACSIDFGLTSDGRTLPVEVNDAFALGHYGLPSIPYAQMIEARWLEMVTAR